MSPILVRPVREQLEHDRIVRLLHAKFRRKYEAGMNPGNEQNVAVGTGPTALFPDIVLLSQDRGHRLQGVVEVETGESVNHLEALAQWAHYARLRAPFHLYVPATMVEVARRLSEDNQIHAAEIWSYHVVGDEPRFTLVHRNREAASGAKSRPAPTVNRAVKAAAPKPAAPKPAAPKPAAPKPAAPKPAAPKAAVKPKAKSAKPKKAAAKPKSAKSAKTSKAKSAKKKRK